MNKDSKGAVATKQRDVVEVLHWNSPQYVSAPGSTVEVGQAVFAMEIEDKRRETGQAWITTAAEGGAVDDMLSICMEVNALPGSRSSVAAAHVHFDGDSLAFTAFKRGDDIVLRLERGVTLERSTLDGGTDVFIVR